MTNNKEIQTVLDVPTREHWQLVRFEQQRIENSYGEDTFISIPKIDIFMSIEELETEVLRLQLDKFIPPFFVQKVYGRAEIVTTVKVKIQ